MISGMFPAGLKAEFKLCNDGPAPQWMCGNVMGGQSVRAAILRVQSPKCGQHLKRPNRSTATTALARIYGFAAAGLWVQGGGSDGMISTMILEIGHLKIGRSRKAEVLKIKINTSRPGRTKPSLDALPSGRGFPQRRLGAENRPHVAWRKLRCPQHRAACAAIGRFPVSPARPSTWFAHVPDRSSFESKDRVESDKPFPTLAAPRPCVAVLPARPPDLRAPPPDRAGPELQA
jgi:hypothetical protein